jgi:hypothetical protein
MFDVSSQSIVQAAGKVYVFSRRIVSNDAIAAYETVFLIILLLYNDPRCLPEGEEEVLSSIAL